MTQCSDIVEPGGPSSHREWLIGGRSVVGDATTLKPLAHDLTQKRGINECHNDPQHIRVLLQAVNEKQWALLH